MSGEAGPQGPASRVRSYTLAVVARPRLWGGVLAACVLTAGSGTAAGGTRSAVLHGTVRARVTTALDGSYRLALAPGAYGVRVTRPSGIRRLRPSAVRLVRGEVKRVTFYLDTGIR